MQVAISRGISQKCPDKSGDIREQVSIEIINKQFLTQVISKRLNEIRSENEQISDRAVSSRIKRLGFDKIRFKNGRMGFRINEERLESLKSNYKIIRDPEGSEG